MTAGSSRKARRQYTKYGLTPLKHAVRVLGARALTERTSVAKALAAWRSELLADLGGIENVTTQELALIEEAVKTKLILDSVDAWLLSQPSLINKRTRSVLPVVRDRQALVATLRGLLGDLGLQRRSRTMPELGEYLAQHNTEPPTGAPITYVGAQLGHSKPTTTLQWYATGCRAATPPLRGRSGLGPPPESIWHQFGTKLPI